MASKTVRLDVKAKYSIEFMRRLYWRAQDAKCPLCGGKMTDKINSPKLNFDHVWPVSNLHVSTDPQKAWRGNVLLVHTDCNGRRGNDRPTPEYVDRLREINRKLGLPPNVWDQPIEREAAE